VTSDHPIDELPALVAGELDLETLREVVRHLRDCPACQAELVEIAAAAGALRYSATLAGGPEVTADDLPPLPARLPARRRRRVPVVASAAIALVAAVAIILAVTLGGSSSRRVSVTLSPIGQTAATGRVVMSGPAPQRTMTVETSLPAAPPASFYQVWLLNTAAGKMLPVGLLSGGRGRYILPAGIVAAYDAVDISLQADNGNPAHSADSVLRGRYA
jgi:Anti-sigma-K factor rskA/Putative zinc-finger